MLRRPLHPRRQQRRLARLDAAAPEGGGPAPHQRAGRRHQLHQPGSRPPAARLRRRQARRRHPRAPRPEGREIRRASTARTHEADETMCVIADDRAVLGFGGILGGEDTGCTHETRNVLIECAYFDPLRTAATGRKTGIVSDARYRFERGVDPAFILPGLDLATAMMMEVAGGTPSKSADRRRAAGGQDRHRLPAEPHRQARRHRDRGEADPRHAGGAGLRHRGQGRDGQGHGAELAARRPRARRPRRGGGAHRRPRQGAVGADAAPGRRGARRAHRSPAPRAPGASRPGGTGHDRGHHLVVHIARHGSAPSAAARMRWSSPIPSRARCRRCGRACCRACSPPCRGTATAALPTSRCSR